MAKEKVVYQEEMTEYERLQMVTDAKEKAKESVVKLHIKISQSHEKYLQYKNLGRLDEAAKELRWYLFNQKLKNFTEKMMEFLDRVEGMKEVFQIIGVVNQGLGTITGFQQGVEIKTLKKNLKNMKKALKSFDKLADTLTGALDDVFGDKPNFFVRLFRRITGNQKTDAQILEELEKQMDPSLTGGPTPDGQAPQKPQDTPKDSNNTGGGGILDGWDLG